MDCPKGTDVKPLYFFLIALDFSSALRIFDFRDLSSLIDSLDSFISSLRWLMTSFLMPFFFFMGLTGVCFAGDFDCMRCKAVYYHCMTQNYHLCNDFYYFSTEPGCELKAAETLGKIKAYRAIMDTLKPIDKSSAKVCDCRGIKPK